MQTLQDANLVRSCFVEVRNNSKTNRVELTGINEWLARLFTIYPYTSVLWSEMARFCVQFSVTWSYRPRTIGDRRNPMTVSGHDWAHVVPAIANTDFMQPIEFSVECFELIPAPKEQLNAGT